MNHDYDGDYIAYHRKAWDREYERRAKLAAQSLAEPPSATARKKWRHAVGSSVKSLGQALAFLVLMPIWLFFAAIYLAIIVGILFVIVGILHVLWSAT